MVSEPWSCQPEGMITHIYGNNDNKDVQSSCVRQCRSSGGGDDVGEC